MRSRPGVLAALAAIAMSSLIGVAQPPAAAQESPGETFVEVCRPGGVIELDARTCVGLEAGSVLLASLCGQLPLPADACATLTDGRVVDSTQVDAYQDSWVHRALRLQERLDRREPLKNSLVPHTHNSSNSTAYTPTVTAADPNQRYTIADQLRMDIRGIELDLHWIPSRHGTPETGGKAVVLCHGRSEDVGDLTVHLACSDDQPFSAGLLEIRSFLDAAGNEEQVVLLYLENQLEDDPDAHAAAVADIERTLGDLVERPPGAAGCSPMPMEMSRQDMLDRGHRVLLVGNCGPGAWGGWVFERGPLWNESGHDGAYPDHPACIDSVRADREYDANWIRHWEDLTWLSAMVEGDQYPITPAVTRAMVRCGVDMIGFDRLEPFDGRLEALVWSWAPDEPVLDASLACAARGDDGRFRMRACDEVRPFSCRTAAGAWTVPDLEGAWGDGDQVCASVGASFEVPPLGWENERLGVAAAARDVWIPIGIADVGVAPPASGAGTTTGPSPSTGSVAATGGSPPLGLAMAAIVVLLAVVRRRRPAG